MREWCWRGRAQRLSTNVAKAARPRVRGRRPRECGDGRVRSGDQGGGADGELLGRALLSPIRRSSVNCGIRLLQRPRDTETDGFGPEIGRGWAASPVGNNESGSHRPAAAVGVVAEATVASPAVRHPLAHVPEDVRQTQDAGSVGTDRTGAGTACPVRVAPRLRALSGPHQFRPGR